MSNTKAISYLQGIADNDYGVLQQIYKESLPEVIKYVQRNSGTSDDAKDIFQEGILVIYRKIKKDELVLTTSFHVYLFAVCKRIWLKKIKRKGKKEVTMETIEAYSIEESFEDGLIKSRKWALYNRMFLKLTEECQKVLKMAFNGMSGKEIALNMGYTEEYVKRKKYKCRISLTNMIKKDPEYHHLIEAS